VPAQLQLDLLYRHPKLNPGDVYIPKPLRERLHSVWEVGVKKIKELRRLRSQAQWLEYDQRLKDGTARRINVKALAKTKLSEEEFAKFEKNISSFPRGLFPEDSYPVTYRRDGDFLVYCLLQDMPVAQRLVASEEHLKTELAYAIFSWFGDKAGLPEPVQLSLLFELAEEFHK